MLNIILVLIPLRSKKSTASKICHRSSRTEGLCKKDALQKLAKFIGKHLSRNMFFFLFFGNYFIKKETPVFPKFSRTPPVAAFIVIFSGEVFNNTYSLDSKMSARQNIRENLSYFS